MDKKKMTKREERRAQSIYNFLASEGFGNLDKIAKGTKGFEDLADTSKTPPVRTLKGSINFYMSGKYPGEKFPPRIQRLIDRYNIRPPHKMLMMQMAEKEKKERFKKSGIKTEEEMVNRTPEDELQDMASDSKISDEYEWDDVINLSPTKELTIEEMKDELLSVHDNTISSDFFPRGDRFKTEFESLGVDIANMSTRQIMMLYGEYSRDNFFEYINVYGSAGDGINTNGLFYIKQSISKAMSI